MADLVAGTCTVSSTELLELAHSGCLMFLLASKGMPVTGIAHLELDPRYRYTRTDRLSDYGYVYYSYAWEPLEEE